jgi:hypothetical protein
MDRLTAIKIKYEDGTYSDEIPIYVTAENVEYNNEYSLIETLGYIDIKKDGNIQQQINKITSISARIPTLENRIANIQGGTPTVVDDISDMIDTDQIYILSTDSKWYYYDLTSSAWVAGGTYGAIGTDSTLTQSGIPADAKVAGDKITTIKNSFEKTFVANAQVLTVKLGEYIRQADGKNVIQSGAKTFARSALFYTWRAPAAVRLENDDYRFCVFFYDESGNIKTGAGYLYNSGYMINQFCYMDTTANKFGVVYRRDDGAELTEQDADIILSDLHCYGYTDDSLSLDDVPADAKSTGDKIGEVSDKIAEMKTYTFLHTPPQSEGAYNAIRRARQLADLKWTPAENDKIRREYFIPANTYEETREHGFRDDSMFFENECTGAPYSSRNLQRIGTDVSLETFVSSAGMEKSVMLAESQEVRDWGSTYYGTTCSNLVSYALGLPPISTSDMVWYDNNVKKMMPGLTFVHDLIVNGVEQNMNDAQLADILWAPGHCAMITDIIKKDGVVTDIEVTESSMTFLSTARRWMWKIEDFYRWFAVFGLYRYSDIGLDAIKYYPNLFAPMPDEGQRFAYINKQIMPYYGNKCIVSSSNSTIRLIVKNVAKVSGQSGEMAYTHILIRKNGASFGNPIEIDLTKGDEPYYVDVPIDEDEALYTALLCAYEDNAISKYTSECKWIVKSAHTPQITFDENNTLKIVVTLRNLGFKPEYYIASINNTIFNRNAYHITQDMLQEEVNGDNVTYTIIKDYEDSRAFKRFKVGYTSPEYGTFFELYDM